MTLGASVQLVFGFEYAILLTVAYSIGIKYICHGIDLRNENPWENKAMYLLYTELFVGKGVTPHNFGAVLINKFLF